MGSIESRRSIRRFKDVEPERESLEAVLRAGLQAPSPKNRQPWRFVVLSGECKRELAEAMRGEIALLIREKPDREDIRAGLETMDIISAAPVLILVCYEHGTVKQHDDGVDWQISARDVEAVELQSIGAAVENMLLKAEELGMGSLWCADILYAYRAVSKYSKGPVVSAVCLGYKDEEPGERPRKALEEMCEFCSRGQ